MAKMATKILTDKQERFCREYIIDNNGTQAAIRSGYSEKTAQEQSSRLLSNVIISTKIKELSKKIDDKLELNAEWVKKRFMDISNRCMTVEPVMKYDPDLKRMVQETDINDKGEEVGLYQFDSSGANKATEMLGKHIGFFDVDNKQKIPISKDKFTVTIVRPTTIKK